MNIQFKTTKLRKECTITKTMKKRWGERMAGKIRQRLDDLNAAPALEAMRRLPGRCHELRDNRAGTLSLDLVHPQRLWFAPADDPIPLRDDGGLDWSAVFTVEILGVIDTHE